MSKPSITNVLTTQTFQNWLDKTNEVVAVIRDSAVTASGSGDSTTGDATLVGDFTANNVIAYDELRMDDVSARTVGGTIDYASPIQVTGAVSPVVATFNYGASGGKTRYTDGTYAWDIGIDNSTDTNFTMASEAGTQFTLSTNGVLTVPSITTTADITIGTSITTGNVTSTDTLTANTATATQFTCNNMFGNFTGDIYHPAGAKVLENGGPAANIPATFTGNVNGTVSSLTNHTTDNLTEGSNSRYFTTSRARDSVSAGTGLNYDSATGVFTTKQDISTLAQVKFKTIQAGDGSAFNNPTVEINGPNGTIVAEGDITAFGSVSDITMKENINPIENALDKVKQLGGYTFNYINKPETSMTGVIAQEVEQVLPEGVYKTIDGKTGEEIYAVRHGNLIGLIIEAIKELSAKVEK